MAWEGVADAITAIINEVGRDVTVRTNTQSGDAWNPVLTPTDVPNVKAAIVDYTAGETDGSIIQADDKKAYISSTTTITKQDIIIDGALEYHIQKVRLVKPGDEVFLYIAQLRL